MKKNQSVNKKHLIAALFCISAAVCFFGMSVYADRSESIVNGNVTGSISPSELSVKSGDEFTLTFTYSSGLSDVRAVKAVNIWDETKFRRIKVEASEELEAYYFDIDRIGYDDHTAGFASPDGSPMPSSGSIMYTYEALGDCTMEPSDISASVTVAAVTSENRAEVTPVSSVSFAHAAVLVPEAAPTCTENGHTRYWQCGVCGKYFSDAGGVNEISGEDTVLPALGHDWDDGTVTKEPTVFSDGIRTYTCRRDSSHTKTEIIPKLNDDPEGKYIRLYGSTRYDTCMAIADRLKKDMGVDTFPAAVVASGEDYPDALAGAYLAKMKKAPILLVNDAKVDAAAEYIRSNVAPGGQIYLLGGESVVPDSLRGGLAGYDVRRLGGCDRYETNLLILREAGVADEDILVCSGMAYADGLSASASGLPVVLVSDNLRDEQRQFLAGTGSWQYFIIGGTGVVNESIEQSLKVFGEVTRLGGATRYQTSVMTAERLYGRDAKSVTFAYGLSFPDGLCGGPLALNGRGPLILASANPSDNAAAAAYVRGFKPGRVYVLGGASLIDDNAVLSMLGD